MSESQSIARWIIRVINSCKNIKQLENAFNLIDLHYNRFSDRLLYLDLCNLYKDYKTHLS